VVREPVFVLTAPLVLLVVLGMLPALGAYRASKAEHALMRDRDARAGRIQEWLRRHPEKEDAEGPRPLKDEAAVITFLQETARRVGAEVESVKPVFSPQSEGAATQARRLLVHLRSHEQGLRAFLFSLEETPMPWRIEEIQIAGDRGREGGVDVHLALERMGEREGSLKEIEDLLAQEGCAMKTSRSADPGRTFFRAPVAPPAAPQEESGLAVISRGWRLVGVLQGVDSRAIIEDGKSRRVFSVRPGDTVAGATAGPIDADAVVFTMGAETLRLTFE